MSDESKEQRAKSEARAQVSEGCAMYERVDSPSSEVTIEEYLGDIEDTVVFGARVCTDYAERVGAESFAAYPAAKRDIIRAAVLDQVASTYEESTGCRATLMPGLVPNYARDLFYAGVGLYEQLGGEHPDGVSAADMHQLAHDVIDRNRNVDVEDIKWLTMYDVDRPVYDDTLSDVGHGLGGARAYATCDLLHSREYLSPEFGKFVRGMRRRPEDMGAEARALAEVIWEMRADSNADRVAAETICDDLEPTAAVLAGAAVARELGAMAREDSKYPNYDRMNGFKRTFVIEATRRGLADDPVLLDMAKDPGMEHVSEHTGSRRVPDVPGVSASQQATDTIDY